MEIVERTVAVRDCRDEDIRGRAGIHALNQPVGGNCIARIKYPSTGRAAATVKYNRPIEQHARGGRHQSLSRHGRTAVARITFGHDVRHPPAAYRQ